MMLRRIASSGLLLLMLAPLAALATAQRPFRTPEPVLVDGPTTGPARMAYSTSGQLVWEPAADRVSFAYWEEPGEATPATPNRVWLSQWSDATGWQSRRRLDHSAIGARHPAMLLLPGGDLLAAWYDYRNCTLAGGWSDNIEVYSSRWPASGAIAAADTRLTDSGAVHAGDNGYVPQLARLPNGRVAMVWYDFHWDADVSEIALRLSDTAGNFAAPPPAIDSMRLTNPSLRAAGDALKPFTMPQIAADTSGTLHITWTTGTSDVPASLYYGRYDPSSSSWLDGPRRLRQGVRGHLDPPRLASDAATGSVWMAYVDRTTNGNDDIWLQRRRLNAADWDAPLRFTTDTQAQNFPALKIDALGQLHLAYINNGGSPQTLFYDVINPDNGISLDHRIVGADKPNILRPALALDAGGWAYIAWESDPALDRGEMWFATNRPPRNAVLDWLDYR